MSETERKLLIFLAKRELDRSERGGFGGDVKTINQLLDRMEWEREQTLQMSEET